VFSKDAPASPPLRRLPFSPASLIPTSYHRLAKLLLDEGVADHEQAYALTKMMLQVAQREQMWDDDRYATYMIFYFYIHTYATLSRKESQGHIDRRFKGGLW
jgi:hypothetical protein